MLAFGIRPMFDRYGLGSRYAELQAIAQNTLPGLDGIAQLPAEDDAPLLAGESTTGLDRDSPSATTAL